MRNWIVMAVSILLLAGCGGSSGGGPGPLPPPPENNLPVAVNDTAVTTMEMAVDIDVLANDTDPDGDVLVVSGVTQASQGTVTITAAGEVRYTPAAGFSGRDSFTYEIDDGQSGNATGTVSVTVSLPGGSSIERVSVASDGSQGNFDCWMGSSSSDGRYVAFYSGATNLYPGATAGDILLRDRLTSLTTLVSSDLNGSPGNLTSQQPAISGDDRFVVFSSFASNLVPSDTNDNSDIFIKDLQTGAIERVSVATDGSEGDEGSFAPSISADGRFVAFESFASNFFSGDTPANSDIFVRDRQSHQTEHIGSGGAFDNGPCLSGDGRYVAFSSFGQLVVYDRQTQQSTIASLAPDDAFGNGESGYPSCSGDGRYIAFTSVATNLVAGDSNGVRDVFVRDMRTATTTRVSVASDATEGNAAVPDSEKPGLSSDGRFVAFTSAASNLVAGDLNGVADAFVHDVTTGATERVSVSSGGVEANGGSGDFVLVSVSANGSYVVLSSFASNLVAGDSNNFGDVFVAPNPFVP